MTRIKCNNEKQMKCTTCNNEQQMMCNTCNNDGTNDVHYM